MAASETFNLRGTCSYSSGERRTTWTACPAAGPDLIRGQNEKKIDFPDLSEPVPCAILLFLFLSLSLEGERAAPRGREHRVRTYKSIYGGKVYLSTATPLHRTTCSRALLILQAPLGL